MAERKLKDTGGMSRQMRRRKKKEVAKERWNREHKQRLRQKAEDQRQLAKKL